MPAMNAAASPLLRRKPHDVMRRRSARATSAVPSRDPSSTTSTSIDVDAGNRGAADRAAWPAASAASLRHGNLDDELLHVSPRSRLSMTPSQVMRRAPRRSRRRPMRRRAPRDRRAAGRSRRRSPRRRARTTKPFTPSTTNSFGPPESVAVITGLRAEKRLERDVAEVLVERRIDDAERARVELDQLRRRRPRPGSVTRSRHAERLRPGAPAFARCVPSPATTSRIARSTCAIAATSEIDPLDRSRCRPTDST